jgi:enoyl-CoA hydratase
VEYQNFSFHIEGKIACLRLNRPNAYNSINPVFFQELTDVLASLQTSGAARVLVISSEGKHFTSGMAIDALDTLDLDEQTAGGRATIALQVKELRKAFDMLEELRMPVIVAIQGGCIGGGVDLVSACDIRLAEPSTFFSIQEINIGMVADLGTLQRLPKLVPEAIVHEMAYTGRRLSAQRALMAGLVNEICGSQAEMLAAAMQMANEIAEKSPVAIWGTKQAIHYARDHSTYDALQQMAWLQSGLWQQSVLSATVDAKKRGTMVTYDDLPPARLFADAKYEMK